MITDRSHDGLICGAADYHRRIIRVCEYISAVRSLLCLLRVELMLLHHVGLLGHVAVILQGILGLVAT